MKKNYLFLVFAIFTAICLFAAAATCSFCGINLGSADEDTTESDKETASAQDETSSGEAASGTNASTEEETDGAEVIEDEEGAEPEPEPAEEPGEEEPVVEIVEEPEPEPEEVPSGEDLRSYGAVSTLSGQISEDSVVFIASDSTGVPGIYVGDTTTGLKVKGFLSFDVSEISGENVLAAWLNIRSSRVGDPDSLVNPIAIYVTNYGNSLDPGDYGASSTSLYSRPLGYSDFSFTNDDLKNAVQNVLTSGRQYFQVKIAISNANRNGVADGFSILLSDVSLQVSYN